MNRQTKFTAISPETKEAVYCRDEGYCVHCGKWVPPFYACAHFIPRARGGLGIEQNILTLCPECHRRYDQGICRKEYEAEFEEYLKSKYPNWNREELVYRWGM